MTPHRPMPGTGRLLPVRSFLLLLAIAGSVLIAAPADSAPARAAVAKGRATLRPSVESAAASRLPHVTGIRCWTNEEYTRIVVDLTAEVPFQTQVVPADPGKGLPERIVVDFRGATVREEIVRRPVEVRNGLLKQVRAGRRSGAVARVVVDLERPAGYQAVEMSDPPRLVLDIESGGGDGTAGTALAPAEGAVIQVPRGTPGGEYAEISSRGGAAAATTPGGAPLSVPREPPPAASPSPPGSSTGAHRPSVSFSEPTLVVTPPASTGTATPAPLPEAPAAGAAGPANRGAEDSSLPSAAAKPAPAALEEVARKARASMERERAEGKERKGAGAAGEGRGKGSQEGEERAAPPVSLTVMLDPGHGGKDPGACGPSGLKEKDVVLALGRKVRERLDRLAGVSVKMTRDTDVFIPLEERTALANRARADLFVSLHINASPDRRAEGFSTYVLSKASDRQSLELAARENGVPVARLTDVKFIIDELALSRRSLTSLRLAKVVNDSLVRNVSARYGRVQDLGLRKAPFYVLVGARMTAILVESSFISNAREEQRLRDDAYLDTIADSVVDAVKLYGRKSNMASAPVGKGRI